MTRRILQRDAKNFEDKKIGPAFRAYQAVKKPNSLLWGCMKGPRPLHIFAPASAYAEPGFRFANNVCEPPAAQSAAFEIRRAGFAGPRSGPSGRFLYHFLAAAKGSKKMMQLRKMKHSFS